jgi:hypothetical protein
VLATACTFPTDPYPYEGLDRSLDAAPAAPDADPAPTVEEPAPAPPAPRIDVSAGYSLPPIRVWVSPDVDSAIVDDVRAGVGGWAQALDGVRSFVFVDATADEVADKDVADIAIYEIGPYGGTCNPDPAHSDETTALGCVHTINGGWDNRSGTAEPIFLISTQVGRAPKETVMHEMGHLFGLTHEAGGLMWGPAPAEVLDSEWECPDVRTMDRIAEKHNLNRAALTSCPLPPAVAELDASIIGDHE